MSGAGHGAAARPIAACPACHAKPRALVLERRPLGAVHVDLCPACRGLWFDAFESTQLAPEGTIALFRAVAELPQASPATSRAPLACPRCGERLVATRDVQRRTRFSYWRCPHGHGRFTPFLQFMREKDFTRPLSPREVEAVRAQIGTVRCSGCGAPVDVGREPACRYCGARIEALDADAIRKALAALAQPAPASPPAPPADSPPARDPLDDWLAAQRDMRRADAYRSGGADLVIDGLRALLDALDPR